MADAPRPVGPRRLVAAVVVGVLLVIVALLAAPRSWDPGPSTLEVTRGAATASTAVALGSDEPVDVVVGSTRVVAPGGLAVDAPIRLELPGTDPDGVAVTLVRPGGEREVMPVLADGGGAVATRRPPGDAHLVLALVAVVIVLWVSELVALHVTGLLVPIALVLADVTTARDALAPFFDPIIVLFFAGFLLALAMQRVGLDRRLAVEIVARFGTGPVRLYATMIGVAAVASMCMSNTAAVSLLIPIALAVNEPLGRPDYRKAMVLGIAYAATIGGVGSLIGTPANPLAARFVDELTGRRIDFVEWFAFGLPLVALFLPIMGTLLWRQMRVDVSAVDFGPARAAATAARRELGPLGRDELIVLVTFLAVLVGWLTQSWHDRPPGIVALAGAVVLMLTGHIGGDDLGEISWPTLLTFGGGLALGVAMVDSGTSDWVVSRLTGVADWPTTLAVAVVAAVSLVTTTVASNTAAAATLVPVAVPLAGLIGVEPALLVVVVAVASSIDFALVIGTPPTMLAYSTGLFTTAEILRRGALLDLLGLALLVGAVVPFWQAIDLV